MGHRVHLVVLELLAHLAEVGHRQPAAVAGKVEQVDLLQQTGARRVGEDEAQLGGQGRQQRARQGHRRQQRPVPPRDDQKGVGRVAPEPLQDIDVHDAVGLAQRTGRVGADQGGDRTVSGVRKTNGGKPLAQGQIGLGQLADLTPQDREQGRPVGGLQVRGEGDGTGPVVGLELRGGLGEALLEVLQQLDHVVRAHPPGRLAGAARLQTRQVPTQVGRGQVPLHLFAVEVVEEGVAQHLGQVDLREQRQLQRIAGRGRAPLVTGPTGEARHQAGRLLAVAGRIHMLDEVEPTALQFGLQFAPLPRRHGRDQVGLAGLGQAEEADADRAPGGPAEPGGEVAHPPQLVGQAVGFAVEPWRMAPHLGHPVERLAAARVEGVAAPHQVVDRPCWGSSLTPTDGVIAHAASLRG